MLMEKNRPPTLRWDARLIKRAQEEVHAAQTYGHRSLTLGGEYFTLCSRISYFLFAPSSSHPDRCRTRCRTHKVRHKRSSVRRLWVVRQFSGRKGKERVWWVNWKVAGVMEFAASVFPSVNPSRQSFVCQPDQWVMGKDLSPGVLVLLKLKSFRFAEL